MSATRAVRPLVLVVDDHKDSCDLCVEVLERAAFRVATAINGLDGMVKALSLHPDAIVMDLAMPDLDGWGAAHQLKAVPATKAIPIIVLSAHVTPEARGTAMSVGCEGFLAKPVLPDELVTEINRLITRGP